MRYCKTHKGYVMKIKVFLLAAVCALSGFGVVLEQGDLMLCADKTMLALTAGPLRAQASLAYHYPDAADFREVAVDDGRFGAGKGVEITHASGEKERFLLYPGWPFVFVQKMLKNASSQAAVVNRVAYPVFALSGRSTEKPWKILGTGGLVSPEKNAGSYMWSAAGEPESGMAAVAGFISTDRASGVVRTALSGDGKLSLLPHADYGRLVLEPGREEWSEVLAAGLFPVAQDGLERYADAIARFYDVKLKPTPAVHCTWYVDHASSDAVLRARADFIAQALRPYGMNVVQVDDGWQIGEKKNGPKKVFTDSNPKGPYPGGMKAAADHIRARGMAPGIWLMPFCGTHDDAFFADKQDWFVKHADGRPFDNTWSGTAYDLTREDTRAFLFDTVHRIVHDWGYTYLKLDGILTGGAYRQIYVNDSFQEDGMGEARLSNPKITQTEMMRNSLDLLRQAAGPDAFLLGCCSQQNMRSLGAVIGKVDAMRVGPDAYGDWRGLLVAPKYGSWQYFYHGRLWHNDPDPFYVRPGLPLNEARAIATWVAVSGQMNTTSESYAALPPERLAIIRATMPAHGGAARPLDLFERPLPAFWRVVSGARESFGVFNWGDGEEAFTRKVAGDGRARVALGFWSGALTPVFTDTLTCALPGRSAESFAVCAVGEAPQAIGTSRHVVQNGSCLGAERWDEQARSLTVEAACVAGDPVELRILTLTTRGARKALHVKSAAEVEAVAAGENLLRIRLKSPETGMIPVTVFFEK